MPAHRNNNSSDGVISRCLYSTMQLLLEKLTVFPEANTARKLAVAFVGTSNGFNVSLRSPLNICLYSRVKNASHSKDYLFRCLSLSLLERSDNCVPRTRFFCRSLSCSVNARAQRYGGVAGRALTEYDNISVGEADIYEIKNYHIWAWSVPKCWANLTLVLFFD